MVTYAPETLITTYLEMTDPKQLRPSSQKEKNVRIRRMDQIDVQAYRDLYRAVGEKWCWRDRLVMSTQELTAILARESTILYVLYVGDAPAGYVELQHDPLATEIVYFGLREEFHGRGLGKYLLSYGIQKAWEIGTKRVWLHTCNLDGPYALANYQKRGFTIYQRQQEPMPAIYQ